MEKGINFEINLTKAKWTPKHVEEIPKVISRAFEKDYTREQLEPIVGTDHIHKWPLHDDSDIVTFLKAESKMRECFAEKVIRYKPPRGLMPKNWEPKKVKILARGERLAKYFGEDEVGTSTRKVDTSLKLFDCGHFYMKQSLPGSGAYPYQMIFEGTWLRAEKGVHLTYLIRYTGQTSKRADLNLAIEALPAGHESSLAWVGDVVEAQLNGLVPAIVGEDPYCRVEICRDADCTGEKKVLTRFNPDAADPPSWEWTPPDKEKEKEKEKSKARAEESASSSQQCKDEKLRPREFKSRFDSPTGAPVAAKADSQPSAAAAGRSQPSAAVAASAERRDYAAGQSADDEPIWPLIAALVVFVLLLILFAWFNWQDELNALLGGAAPESAAPGSGATPGSRQKEDL